MLYVISAETRGHDSECGRTSYCKIRSEMHRQPRDRLPVDAVCALMGCFPYELPDVEPKSQSAATDPDQLAESALVSDSEVPVAGACGGQ